MAKKIFLSIIVLVGAMLLFANANAQWVEQNSGTTVNLISISAPTYQVAWVAGPAGTVKRTTDNGTTWVDKSVPGAGDLWNIYAFSQDKALVTGYNSDYSQDVIWMTLDGGSTWQIVLSLATNYFLNAITFFDANEGIVMGDPDYNFPSPNYWTIYKTYDGGFNWTAIANPPEQLGMNFGWKNSIVTVGNTVFFGTTLFDDNFFFGPDARIYKSTDKGETWSYNYTPGVVQVNTLHFIDAMTGYGCGAKTTDGGNTWFQMNDPYKGDVNKFILSATGVGNEVWVTGIHRNGPNYFGDKWFNYRKLYYSNDGGVTWKKDYEATDAGFNEVRISRDNMALFALKDNGGIIMKMLTAPSAPLANSRVNYELKQNYPNPFNPVTNISYKVPGNGLVSIKVYDMLGKEVAILVNETKTAGTYNVMWNASNMPSGVYFYKLTSGSFSDMKRMILVK